MSQLAKIYMFKTWYGRYYEHKNQILASMDTVDHIKSLQSKIRFKNVFHYYKRLRR